MNDTEVITTPSPVLKDGWWTIRLRASLATRIAQLAQARGVSIATLATQAVSEWLATQDDAPAHGIARPQLDGQLTADDALAQLADEVLTNGI